MNARTEQVLLERLRRLAPEELAQVESFVGYLESKTLRRAALDRLLSIAPALEAAGAAPMSEQEIQAEVDAVRAERRARRQADRADRS